MVLLLVVGVLFFGGASIAGIVAAPILDPKNCRRVPRPCRAGYPGRVNRSADSNRPSLKEEEPQLPAFHQERVTYRDEDDDVPGDWRLSATQEE